MIFATYWFLAFAALFLPLFWVVRDVRLRMAIVLAGSALFFCHFAGSAGVLPIIFLGFVVYLVGLSEAPWAHGAGVALCVFALIAYKYSGFLITNLLGTSNGVGDAIKALLPATPPLAISFFTFEYVHYLLDRKKGNPPIKRPVDFVAFSIFFPSLVAGPIKRYEQFLPSLREGLAKVNRRDVMTGLMQMSLGFAKKVAADNLTLWIERYQQNFTHHPMQLRWLLFAGIGFRILLDFSGYSDIAIGLARMMGVQLPANFNWPYLATSIGEFWHRWHISLSTWIRDYIYIALGGSRKGTAKKMLNCMIAFSLCGLWHGPAWNFITWGLYHGFGLIVSNAYAKIPFGIGKGLEAVFKRVPPLGWALTLLFVWLGWLIFFYPLDTAWKMGIGLFKMKVR